MSHFQNHPSNRLAKRRQGLTLVEVLLAIVLLGGSSLILLHLLRDYSRVVQRSEFEAIAATRCESALALLLSSRDTNQFNQLVSQLSDDSIQMQVQVQAAGHDQLRMVSVVAQPRQASLSSPFVVSRIMRIESVR